MTILGKSISFWYGSKMEVSKKSEKLCFDLQERQLDYTVKEIPSVIGCSGLGMKNLKEDVKVMKNLKEDVKVLL